jgi:hypothetical protein
MTSPRRQVVRPQTASTAANSRQTALLQKRRAQIEQARAGFARWLTRLRRACHALDKQQRRLTRLERELARLTDT